MDYLKFFKLVQITISVFITLLVLVQTKGAGLSGVVGDSISYYRSRRGLEKTIFFLTILFSIFFVINSVLILMLS